MFGFELGDIAGIPPEWLPFTAFWIFLFILVGAELSRPLHLEPAETRGRLVANFGLGIAAAAMTMFLPLSNVLAGQWAEDRGIGLFNVVAVPGAASFAVTLIVRSLAAYALHRLDHALPLLWRIHRVHHCDTAIDVSTSFRAHPAALLIQAAWLAAVAILLGASVPALILYEILAGGFSLWSHANFRLPGRFERMLRIVLITPQMHHVHHSALQAETDSNFGDVFSAWDQLFGTYRTQTDDEFRRMRVGLGDAHDKGAGSLVLQIRSPLLNFDRDSAGASPIASSESRQEGGEVGAERVDRIAALHNDEGR